jgi:hypothetical protein
MGLDLKGWDSEKSIVWTNKTAKGELRQVDEMQSFVSALDDSCL